MKECVACKTEMKKFADTYNFPNKEIIVSGIFQCPKCGTKVYVSNIMDVAEKRIKETIKRAKENLLFNNNGKQIENQSGSNRP